METVNRDVAGTGKTQGEERNPNVVEPGEQTHPMEGMCAKCSDMNLTSSSSGNGVDADVLCISLDRSMSQAGPSASPMLAPANVAPSASSSASSGRPLASLQAVRAGLLRLKALYDQ